LWLTLEKKNNGGLNKKKRRGRGTEFAPQKNQVFRKKELAQRGERSRLTQSIVGEKRRTSLIEKRGRSYSRKQ